MLSSFRRRLASIRCYPILQSAYVRYLSANLSPAELQQLSSSNYVVDVREPHELADIPAIPGAHNLPLSVLPQHIGNLPKKNVIFYCRSGMRSQKALTLGLEAGLEEPKHLEGGIMAWVKHFNA